MSFKEVTELRKAGQLTQAYNMALADMNASHSDVWSCRAMFWVLFDMSKSLIEQRRFDNISNFLKQCNWVYERLRGMNQIDDISRRSHDSLVRKVADALLQNNRTVHDVVELFEEVGYNATDVLEAIRMDYFFRLYNATRKGDGNPHDIINEYITKFQNSASSDAHSRILSSVLWIYRADDDNDIAKFTHFFNVWGVNNLQQSDWKTDNPDYDSVAIKTIKRIYTYLSKNRFTDIDKYIHLFEQGYKGKYFDFHLKRKYAILLVHQGKRDEALKIYKHLLRKKQEWYLYSEMAHLVDNADVRLGLFAKAILKCRNEDFVGAIHLQVAQLCIDKNLLKEAATELMLYKNTYERNRWKLDAKFFALQSRVDLNQATKNNVQLYKQYESFADDNELPTKVVEGQLKYIAKDHPFAFVEDCYVSAKLLEKNQITGDCHRVKAKVQQQADGKWKVIKILEIEK